MRTLEQIVEDQMSLLPQSIRAAVDSSDWRTKIYEIGKKHNLHIDQLGALEQETKFVMIGLTPSKQFAEMLQENVKVTFAEAISLINDIDEQIFKGMKDFLVEMDTLDETIAKMELGIEAENPTEIPSREDLLKEIEDERSMGAPTTVVTSPIAQKLSTPTVSTASTSVTTVAAPAPAAKPAASETRPAPAPLSQAIPKPNTTVQAPASPAPSTPVAPAASTAPATKPVDPYREQF